MPKPAQPMEFATTGKPLLQPSVHLDTFIIISSSLLLRLCNTYNSALLLIPIDICYVGQTERGQLSFDAYLIKYKDEQ